MTPYQLILKSTLLSCMSAIPLALHANQKQLPLHISLSYEKSYRLFIHPSGSVISFPQNPTQITTSSNSSFSISQNGADVILLPLSKSSKGRLFIYLGKKRLVIDLLTSSRARSTFIFKNPNEELFRPEFK